MAIAQIVASFVGVAGVVFAVDRANEAGIWRAGNAMLVMLVVLHVRASTPTPASSTPER